MEIKFTINPHYDTQMILGMLNSKEWQYRAKFMGIDLKLAEKFHFSKREEQTKIQNQITKIVENNYKLLTPYMEKTKFLYEESWKEIIKEFSSTIEKVTYPWFYKEYICVITHFNPGLSDWNGNVIGRWWKENPYTQRRITAHEIILAHYFSIYRHHFNKSGLTDRQVWALAEIAGFALTGLEKRLQKFWPWDTSGYYTNHNYPQIVELQNQLLEPFLKRNSFKEYVEKGIELVKSYQLEK